MERNLSQAKSDLEGGPPNLEVGVEVNFDTSRLCEKCSGNMIGQ